MFNYVEILPATSVFHFNVVSLRVRTGNCAIRFKCFLRESEAVPRFNSLYGIVIIIINLFILSWQTSKSFVSKHLKNSCYIFQDTLIKVNSY